MQNARAFKKRYILFILLAVIAFGVYKALQISPLEQKIIKKVKVSNLVNLYVTEASAGATTGFSYRYYLHDAKENDADFIAHVDDDAPFMITDDSTVTISVKDGQIYLLVRGKVYSFRNTSDLARVHLDAEPY